MIVHPPTEESTSAESTPVQGWSLAKLLIGVAAVAIMFRVVFFCELLRNLPFYRSTYEGYDQHVYNLWAQKVAAGDWLSRSQGTFYFAPLYPYLLAGVYWLAGPGNVSAGIAMNGAFGVCAAVLAAGLAARLFGFWGGMVAGVLMALNAAQLSVEAMLIVDSLVPAFCLGALWLIVRNLSQEQASNRVPLWMWVLPGLLLGIAVVARATNLVVGAALCTMVAVPSLRRRRWRYVAAAAAMGAATCLVAAVPVIRNGLMFGRWTTTLNGPVTLYVGNAPGASGVFLHPPGFREAYERLGKIGHPASAWLRELYQRLRKHPGALCTSLLRKTLLFFNSWDAPDNGNYYFVRRYVASARALTFGPLFLYVAGFLGIILTARNWRALMPLYVSGASLALSLILVLVTGRYKLPFLAVLCLFGGGGGAAIVGLVRARRFAVLAASLLLAGILAAAFWPRGPMGFGGRWMKLGPGEFLNNAALLMAEGREDEALAMLEDGYALFPEKPEFSERLAYLYLDTAQPQRAAAITEAAVQNGIISKRILERRLLAYRALGLADKASKAAEELARHYPESELAREAWVPSGETAP